jgi:hypothetical protein
MTTITEAGNDRATIIVTYNSQSDDNFLSKNNRAKSLMPSL